MGVQFPPMSRDLVLTDYIELALAEATYDKLEDDSFVGRVPSCPGVIAFASTLFRCEHELRSTLEDWILVGLQMGHPLPVVGGIDLSRKPASIAV